MASAPALAVEVARGRLREDILRHARELFAEQGYNGTSVRQVVERCACTKPALYHYFKSKEDLYRQLIASELDSISQMMRESMLEVGTTRERMIGALHKFVDYFDRNPAGMRLLQRIEVQPEEGAPRFDVGCSRELHLSMIEAFVRQGMASGEIRSELDAQECAVILVGTLTFQIQLHMAHGQLCRERLVRSVGMIFDGISTR